MFVFSVNHNGHNFLLEELGVIDKIYVSGYLSIILIIKIPHICHKMGTNLLKLILNHQTKNQINPFS
jgi:hypothetical protein